MTGSTVTLSWNPPPGAVSGYRLEAGTAPGASNLANGVVGAVTRLSVTAVPAGTYYLRVRAIAADGESAPSNEVVVTVGGGAAVCGGPPASPTGLTQTINGQTVTLSWAPAGGCPPTNYVLLAGSAPGSSNLAVVNVGPGTSVSAAAPPGSYYVRVVAQNAFGTSGSSNEVAFAIGGTPAAPGPPTTASAAASAYCVDETNRYRAAMGAAPVARSAAVEAYATTAAAADSATRVPHSYSRAAAISGAFAENEVLRWPLAAFGTVENAMRGAIAAFWAEGPGGGHYENLRGPYSFVGCGVAIDGGAITIVQHFR